MGMPRPLPCLVAAMSLFACQPPADDGEASTGAQTLDSSSTATPTTGDDHGETTAPPATSDTSDTSDTGDESDDTTTSDGECWLELHATVAVPRVMLVLDKSGSMDSESAGHWDHDANPDTPEVTRWNSLHATVESLVTKFEKRIDFGAVLFPSLAATQEYSAAACPVEATPDVPVGPDQAAAILAAIPGANATKLHGGTPTTAGIRTALAGLASDDPEVMAQPHAIVLVTDGAANCSAEPIDDQNSSLFEVYDETLAPLVAEAFAKGIPTHVVGIDIADELSSDTKDGEPDLTNTFARLNELAEAGGHPRPGPEKFYHATSELGLEQAFQEVFMLSISCTIDLGRSLEDYVFIRQIEVGTPGGDPLEYGGSEVQDCAKESGWLHTDATRSAIKLCGDACTNFQATGELDIVLDCYVE